MIPGYDYGSGKNNVPIAVKCQKRQRAENVKMRLDPSARKMNEQPSHQHLSDRHQMACRCSARQEDHKADLEEDYGSAQ